MPRTPYLYFVRAVACDVGDDGRPRWRCVGGDNEGVGGWTLALLSEGSKDDAVFSEGTCKMKGLKKMKTGRKHKII